MKSSNTVVTVVVITAVLVGAYGMGLLIHRARMGNSQSAPAAIEVNEAQIPEQTAMLSHGPGTGKTKDSQEFRAKQKERHAEILQKMETATAEEKEQVRQQIRERFTAARSGRPKPAATSSQPVDPNREKTGAEPNAAGPR